MTIDDLYRNEKISVRSYHLCKYNKLNTIVELIDCFNKQGTFKFLRNCGEKSNEELIEIYNIYQAIYSENKELESQKETPLKTIVSELTRIQREAINSFILVNTNSLSIRSKNAISLHLKDNFKIKNFAENIFLNKNFSVSKIKNVGSKSIPELEIYIGILKDFLIEVSELKNEKHLISLKNNFLIQHTFSISKIPNEILESESIFLLTDFLLNQNAFFDETQTIIVKKALKIYQDTKELTLDDIALEVNLSRERVKQIRKLCVDDLFNKLLFIQNFNDDLLQKYNIDINSNQIEINSDTVKIINTLNNINLSREFINCILYSYLYDNFLLIGNIEDVLQPKYINARNARNIHNWNSFYLIKKEIIDEIDFKALTKDIDIRISDRIEESYSFNFKSYLSRFLTNNNIEILDLVFPIAEKIINDEFELHLDLDDNIIFERNTPKQVPEYIIEALEDLGKPSKLKTIYLWIQTRYPEVTKSEEALRGSCQRSNQVICFGRSSTYGLKKWEHSRDNIKGGTIRQIAEEFLLNHNLPKHKKEITKYVKQFRPKTNTHSIYNNLYIEESNTFVFFENYYIGLSTKNYPDNFKTLSKTGLHLKHSWEESFEILKQFIDNKKRLPYSSGCAESEKKLYRWFNIQKQKSYDGKLENEKVKLITEIDNKFYKIKEEQSSESTIIDKPRKKNKLTKYSLSVLINFIKEHRKIPDSRIIEEKNLYQFYYRTKKNIEKLKIFTTEESELFQLIEKYGPANRNSKLSIDNLIIFFEESGRIPNPKDETDLYQYYHRQKRKLLNLSNLKGNELKLKCLIEKYQSTSLRVAHSIQELIKFITINGRLPNSKDINESKLYQYYFRKRQLFDRNELDTEEEIKFIEVARLLQNIKYENKRN